MAATIRGLADHVASPPEVAVQHLADAGADFRDGWQGISPFVTASVAWSLYAFLHTPTSFMSTMATAIAVGGDVDTTAAMAGAISGAHLGLAGIPADLARAVHDQGTWGHDELLALADQAHELTRRA